MENYYHLTKKELSFISSEQAPIIGTNGKRLTQPVVVVVFNFNNTISRVYTLKWFKQRVKDGALCKEYYTYHIRAMY